jgi:hypothetical protein
MFYNNYYYFSTILVLVVIYIILNQINNKKLNSKNNSEEKDDSKKDDTKKDDTKEIDMIENKYDFICVSFDNIDIEKILETLVDKYYMNGILIGKFNFKKRDYCKWIDIKKEELDEDKLIKVYLQSRFYLKIDDKNIIKNMNMPILDIQKNENIETCIQNLVENYDTLKTK